MFRGLTFVLVALFALSTAVDANTQESLELKMYDHDFQPSYSQMIKMLKEADLEGHGYKKEVTLRLVQDSGSDKPRYDESHLYYKIVSCSQVQEVYQELYILLPGAFGLDMVFKYSKEVKYSHLDSMQHCKAGVEVHFKKDRCYNDGKISKCRKKRGNSTGWCFICLSSSGVKDEAVDAVEPLCIGNCSNRKRKKM